MSALLDPRLPRAAFFAAAVAAVVLALLPPQNLPPPFPHADKVQHFAIFLVLGGLARLGFAAAPARLIVERLAFFGAGIEVVQSIPLFRRDCDALDWAADIAGAVLGLALASALAAALLRRRG